MATDERVRILVAVTEASPIQALWRAVQSRRGGARDVIALVLLDDRWQRAASLPFTREIPRFGGAGADFTRQRADELRREAASRVRQAMTALAEGSDVALGFEELSEADAGRLEELAAGERSILIAPALITREPIYARISRLKCQIELIETDDTAGEAS